MRIVDCKKFTLDQLFNPYQIGGILPSLNICCLISSMG